MIGLETALGARPQAGRREGADAAELIQRLTIGAAQVLRPARRHARRKGAPADVAVLDLDAA